MSRHGWDSSFTPGDLKELLESVYSGEDPADTLAKLEGQPPIEVTAELLFAAASVFDGHAVDVRTPPNRSVLDIAVAGPRDDTELDVTLGAGLLVAACDGTVAQSSFWPDRSGGEALLAALGLPVQATALETYDALERGGFAWLPGRHFQPEPAVRLLRLGAALPWLSLLGPLINPARPRCHLVGVVDAAHTEPMARALGLLGAESALVVSCGGTPGLGLHADTVGHRWSEGRLCTFRHPASTRQADLSPSGGATVDAARLESMFDGLRGPLADTVALNAGAGLWVGGVLPTFAEACRWARSRLSQRVDLSDFSSGTNATSPNRTSPASEPTSRRSLHLPRGGPRRPRDRRG